MTPRHLTTAATFSTALALAFLVGCDSRGSESGVVGKTVAVELRPIMKSPTESVHKQRFGTILKLNADWVVIDENGTEIWIPRDAVLEVVIPKK